MTPSELGDIIRITRCYAGFSQNELAIRARISTMMVRSIEIGRRAPSLEVLNRIGLSLGCYVKISLTPKIIDIERLKEIVE